MRGVADTLGRKFRDVVRPFYVAIAGSPTALPLFDSMVLLGRDLTRERLRARAGDAQRDEGAGVSGRVLAVVLAAGKGTRMKSERPKVLHLLGGRPMLWYVLRALRDAGVAEAVVVASPALEEHVEAIARDAGMPATRVVLQEPQLGTGHAVQVALAGTAERDGTVLVLNGDMPLIDAALVRAVVAARVSALALVTARMPLPSSFGRIVRDDGSVRRIVEERDATDDERAIDEMNAGLYAYDERKLRAAIAELRADNAQREYYLTDTIAGLVARGERVVPVVAPDYRAVLGVNDRAELAAAAARLNALHLRAAHA